jgi:hypothetical protein
MPLFGATFDENSVRLLPLDKGLQGVFERWNKPTKMLRCRCDEGFLSLHPLRRRGVLGRQI